MYLKKTIRKAPAEVRGLMRTANELQHAHECIERYIEAIRKYHEDMKKANSEVSTHIDEWKEFHPAAEIHWDGEKKEV